METASGEWERASASRPREHSSAAMAIAAALSELRARECQREWNGEGRGKQGSGSAFMNLGRGGDGRSTAEPRGASSATRGLQLWQGVRTVQQFQISNSTSNIPLKPILRTSVTPKPRRVSKNSINKSCRSTYQLQLLLKLQRLIRPGLGDTRFQSGVHEN